MHRRRRQQRRDRHALGRYGAIRQDQDVAVGEHEIGRFGANAVEALPALPPLPPRARSYRWWRCGRHRPEAPRSSGSSPARHWSARAADFQPLVRAGLAAQQVGPRADHRHQRHHQLLADRIDRRVGDLGEVLLELVVEQLGLPREHRDRRVRAHRAHRIVRLRPLHRLEEELMSSWV